MAICDKSPIRYLVPEATACSPHCTELSIKRSRFLAQACMSDSAKMARDFIGLTKSKNPSATHNCWAFVAGPPGDTAFIGSSDDGEPHGTAGRPMLQILLHSGIGRICMVVSRWFGGIKLGTGGLVRAYQESVRENLQTLPLVERQPLAIWQVGLDYADIEKFRRLLADMKGKLEEEDYREFADFTISLPENLQDAFGSAIGKLEPIYIRKQAAGKN